MSFFTVDHSNAGEGQVTPGFYEVFVYQYEVGETQTKKERINLFYQVRDDVNQKHRGAKIMYDNFVVDSNVKWKFDSIAKAAGIPDGTTFDNSEEWAQALINKDLKLKIIAGTPNEKGDSYPTVKGYYTTEQPSQNRPMPIESNALFNSSSAIDISDDDLPF